MEKLNKMMEKHKVLKEKQKNNFDLQQKTLASMNEQIKILSAEKDLTLKEIRLEIRFNGRSRITDNYEK